MTRRHVILVTYGEPPTPAFLPQLRYSWRILLGLTRSIAPIPRPLLPLIALRRARLRRRSWSEEAYRSPLEPLTRRQALGLGAALESLAPATRWRVSVAFEFRDPLLPTLLDAIPPGERVDVVPMYAAESAFTHDLSRAAVGAWLRAGDGAANRRPAPILVCPALDEEILARISARHIRRALADAGKPAGPDCALILAAHGTLLKPPGNLATGREATERIGRLIAGELAGDFGMVQNGWLNHVYGGQWTEPPMEDALRRVAGAGYRRAVYFPYGFVADNAESELEGRLALRGRPELDAVHLPCLNASGEYLGAVAGQIVGNGASYSTVTDLARFRG